MSGGWKLPRQTGNLAADMAALRVAALTATTVEQHAAVRLRTAQLIERARPIWASMQAAFAEAFRQIGEVAQRAFGHMEYPGTIDHDCSPGARKAALDAVRNRNTGPPKRRRRPGDFRLAR